MNDIDHAIVIKPWGYEYLMYQNSLVGLWCLNLMKDAATSLHCHPDKKTGLILLSGEAEIRFLNDSLKLKPLNKMILRPGLFHSTAALSPKGVVLLEIETPPIKTNLVRLDDVYGRQDQPYEGPDKLIPLREECIRIQVPPVGEHRCYRLHDCDLIAERINDPKIMKHREPSDLMVVLAGDLQSKTSESVMGAGDVVTVSTFNRLAEIFVACDDISVLTIRKATATAKTT